MKKRIYDFDSIIDRQGTGATKIEQLDIIFGRHDVTPLWIADLDFAVCPEITDALIQRLKHPVLGYSFCPDSYWNSIIDWQRHRHGFELCREEMAFVPGVVKGIGLAVNFFTQKGDGILIQPPVYHPFKMVIEGNGRRLIENPLIADNGTYRMDLEGLADLVASEKPKMMILCNPHNPIGIQWDADTLREVARICRAAGVVVVSDEIHGDLMLCGRRHIPFAAVSDDAAAVSVTLGAPSKTFNIPGLVSSWMVVKNPELRRDFYHWLEVNEFSAPPMISTIGAEAAYRNGEEWLDQMLEYVQENIEFTRDFLAREVPGVTIVEPQASFLLWVDFRGLGLSQQQLMDMLLDHAHIALNDGTMFGRQGEGFARLNIGTPRSVLAEALGKIRDAVAEVRTAVMA
ncbi:MAG: PatB family C-S lyase [Muribaculaceae bacterium]|nr:PatB family C-S lyase [Muribaculaceae bacterium]